MKKSILLFTLSICVITACSQAAIFSDNFESGTFDQWTIGGRQVGRESIGEIVNRNSSQTAHFYQDGFSEIHISKTFSYQNELKFSFDMEALAYSEAPRSDSAWYAGADWSKYSAQGCSSPFAMSRTGEEGFSQAGQAR